MGSRKTREVASWAQEEMATAQLNDKRLEARLTGLLSDLGDQPAASIPAACGGHAEMTAAYRFFDNPKVPFAQILAPHRAATRQRPAAQPVTLRPPRRSGGEVLPPVAVNAVLVSEPDPPADQPPVMWNALRRHDKRA